MKKIQVLLSFVISIILITMLFSVNVSAGKAGVGVLNVPPKYGYISIEEQDNQMRVYITISDYNSWGDIYEVSVSLKDYGAEIAKFTFRQYKDITSYVEINEFIDDSSSSLLIVEKCSFERSNEKETVDQRCDLELRFVFKKTWFTGLDVSVQDRDGSDPAEAHIDYSSEDTMRSSNVLVIPWINGVIVVELPAFLLDLMAVIAGLLGAMICIKKRNIMLVRRAAYEKG